MASAMVELSRGGGMKRKYEEIKYGEEALHRGGRAGSYDQKFIMGQSPATFAGPEVKRSRLTVPSYLIRRSPLELLEEASTHSAKGDRQLAAASLREFATDHLPTLDTAIHGRAAEILVQMADAGAHGESGRVALRYLHSILERASHDVLSDTMRLIVSGPRRVKKETVEGGKEGGGAEEGEVKEEHVPPLHSEEVPATGEVPAKEKTDLGLVGAAKEREGKGRRGGAGLTSREFLDAPLLAIATLALKRGLYQGSSVPSVLIVAGERSERAVDDAQRRVAALRFHVARCMHSGAPGAEESTRWLQKMLASGTKDRDGRVRMAAVEGMQEMATKGQLGLELYPTVKELVDDTDPSVRFEALRVLHSFALRYPKHEVPSSSSSSVRLSLSDDAFCVVCHAVNDMEVRVRSEAAGLLGNFEHVSDVFLEQTLDKKLMKMTTTMKGAKIGVRTTESLFALRKAQKTTGSAGEWSSGKLLNEVAPGERRGLSAGATTKAREDEESLIPQGACGAFISALEDEFMTVRKAGVYSLGRLASTRPAIAALALDHLADMFNDEIEEVRIDSIRALTPLVSRGELFKDQLETIIKCLDDASSESRSALRKLLCKAKFADVECMKLCVRALINCLARFPADKSEIYETMASLGQKHSALVHAITAALFDIHPVFDTTELSLQDAYYVAKLILVLNAASRCEPIVSLLPPFALRHFRYMRAAMPSLVPVIPTAAGREKGKAEMRLAEMRDARTEPRPFLIEEVYLRLSESSSAASLEGRKDLRKYIVEDLSSISSLNCSLAAASRLGICLAERLDALEDADEDVVTLGSWGHEREEAQRRQQQEEHRLSCMEAQFTGMPGEVAAFLAEVRLHLSLYRAMVEVSTPPANNVAVSDALRRAMAEAERRLSFPGTPASSAVTQLLSTLHTTMDEAKVLSRQFLAEAIRQFPIALPILQPGALGALRLKWAKISEPDSEVWMERPLRFVAILPTCIAFVADIHNLDPGEEERLRIQVQYPDESQTIFRPRRSEFSRVNESTLTLRTQVLLGASSAWSDAADVRLTAVLLPPSPSSSPTPSSLSSSSPIPLLSGPASATAASVLIKMQPLNRAGGTQIVVSGNPRDGVVGL